MKNFVMAENNPESIVSAANEALISAMENVLIEIKKESTAPGLTWDQIDFFFYEFKKKKAHIIKQENPI